MCHRLSIVIGRFQPFHKGHKGLIEQALVDADKVLVFLGSHKSDDLVANPFSTFDRETMIRACFTDTDNHKMKFISIRDYVLDHVWASIVRHEVDKIAYGDTSVKLVGYKKDDSSYYLDLFPEYKFEAANRSYVMSGTEIRKMIADNSTYWKVMLPEPVVAWMVNNNGREKVIVDHNL